VGRTLKTLGFATLAFGTLGFGRLGFGKHDKSQVAAWNLKRRAMLGVKALGPNGPRLALTDRGWIHGSTAGRPGNSGVLGSETAR
jgi:hypothetical protein